MQKADAIKQGTINSGRTGTRSTVSKQESEKSCRRDKKLWLDEKSKEAQEATDRNDLKTRYG